MNIGFLDVPHKQPKRKQVDPAGVETRLATARRTGEQVMDKAMARRLTTIYYPATQLSSFYEDEVKLPREVLDNMEWGNDGQFALSCGSGAFDGLPDPDECPESDEEEQEPRSDPPADRVPLTILEHRMSMYANRFQIDAGLTDSSCLATAYEQSLMADHMAVIYREFARVGAFEKTSEYSSKLRDMSLYQADVTAPEARLLRMIPQIGHRSVLELFKEVNHEKAAHEKTIRRPTPARAKYTGLCPNTTPTEVRHAKEQLGEIRAVESGLQTALDKFVAQGVLSTLGKLYEEGQTYKTSLTDSQSRLLYAFARVIGPMAVPAYRGAYANEALQQQLRNDVQALVDRGLVHRVVLPVL